MELRAKDWTASSQMAGLEADVARLTTALDTSRASYSSVNQ
jgi:hypothetical protein